LLARTHAEALPALGRQCYCCALGRTERIRHKSLPSSPDRQKGTVNAIGAARTAITSSREQSFEYRGAYVWTVKVYHRYYLCRQQVSSSTGESLACSVYKLRYLLLPHCASMNILR